MWGNPCTWVQTRLPLLAGGELAGLDRRRAERHLIVCPDCRRRLTTLRGTMDVLRSAAAHASVRPDAPSLWPALARQIRESHRPAPTWTWSWNSALPRIAALVAVGLTTGLLSAAWLLGPPAAPVRNTAVADTGKRQAPPAPLPRLAVPKPTVRLAEQRPPAKDTTKDTEAAPAPRSGGDPDRSAPVAADTRYTQ
jgi:hypothetical protein